MRISDGAAGEERLISLVFGVWRCFVKYLIPNAKQVQQQTPNANAKQAKRNTKHQTPNIVFP